MLLFVVLPSIIAYKRDNSGANIVLAIIFFVVFSLTFVITLFGTFGVINIKPN